MPTDFPVTRTTIDKLDGWLAALCAPLMPPKRVPPTGAAFQWEFREKSARVVQIGKAVRMISGVRAAMLLADHGFVVEAASLLRLVSEFASEILALSEALIENRQTEAQERFVRQYFAPFAQDPDEYERQERERYVTREELFKAHYRLGAKAGSEANAMRKVARYLSYGYDKYVHGAYATAMELFSGRSNRFMLRGHEAMRNRCVAKAAVAGKLHEVVTALAFMALTLGEQALADDIRLNARALESSDEQSAPECTG